jgi:hypothetical protein
MITQSYINLLIGQATNAPMPIVDYNGNTRYAAYASTAGQADGLSLYEMMENPYKNTSLNSVVNNVVFGAGNAVPTIDDYTINDFISGLTVTVQRTWIADDNGGSVTAVYTITNPKSEDVTISEIGLFSKTSTRATADTNGLNVYTPVLCDRTVLDTPVTIPAGGIGQVTYTIRMNYPTA